MARALEGGHEEGEVGAPGGMARWGRAPGARALGSGVPLKDAVLGDVAGRGKGQ